MIWECILPWLRKPPFMGDFWPKLWDTIAAQKDAHMWDISWNITKLQVGCFKHVHIFYPPNATIHHSRHICWVFPLVAGDSVEPSKRLSISGVGGRHIGIAFGTRRCVFQVTKGMFLPAMTIN